MHDLNLAYSFSDEVIVLKEGEIQGHNTPKILMSDAFIKSVFDIHVYHVEDKGLIVIP
jgi:ABC-type cobalamin/Fe3+-siderophores transport system ATPase subunit